MLRFGCLLAITLSVALFGCSDRAATNEPRTQSLLPQGTERPQLPQETKGIVTGGLYYYRCGRDKYRVAKVIHIEIFVHLRIYANKFEVPPVNVDPSRLVVSDIYDREVKGIRWFLISEEKFLKANPVLLSHAPVTDDELVEVNKWREMSQLGADE